MKHRRRPTPGPIPRATGSVNPHGWRECRPVIVELADRPAEQREAIRRAEARLVEWFLQQPDAVRAAQHNVGCWNRTTVPGWVDLAGQVTAQAMLFVEEELAVVAKGEDP